MKVLNFTHCNGTEKLKGLFVSLTRLSPRGGSQTGAATAGVAARRGKNSSALSPRPGHRAGGAR